MKVQWLGVAFVAVLVAGILVLKSHTSRQLVPSASSQSPAVILVADFHEAEENDDPCAAIIRAVREASKRGIRVAELPPDSKSDLLRRYRVLTVPTVLLLDGSGKEIGRFEGEDFTTVKAVQTRLSALVESKP
jgi:hypothetical protein